MAQDGRTLRERVLENSPDIDKRLLTEIAGAEILAGSRSVYAAGNGKWPKDWTLERWMTVLTFLTVVIGWIFFTGGEWSRVKNDIKTASATLDNVSSDIKEIRAWQVDGQRKIDALKVQIETIERSDEYYRTHPRPRPTSQ